MGSFIWFPVIDNHTTFRGSLFQHSYPFILFFHKKLMHEIRKKIITCHFFQTGHVTRHAVSLSHGNKLISFSFGDSAWATRTPEDYTNQTKRRSKEVTMSWTISKFFFYFLGFLIFTNISTYMWMVIIYEWQPFLGFEIFLFALPCQWQFSFLCHFSCKCWLVQNCVC